MDKNFVHLHAHSQFSLFDGYAHTDKMARAASAMGMRHLALTDHGTLGGSVKFYEACTKHGVNPILGCEFYITPDKAVNKTSDAGKTNNHLIVIAKNEAGWNNLIKLSSISHEPENKFKKPRIDFGILEANREGLIVSSACLKSQIAEILLRVNKTDDAAFKEAVFLANQYKDAFGEDYYLELMLHCPACETEYESHAGFLRKQEAVFELTQRLAIATGIKTIITNDVHYISSEEFDGFSFKKSYSMGKLARNGEEGERGETSYDVDEYWMKSQEAMYNQFVGKGIDEHDTDLVGALERTVEVAEKCHVQLYLREKAKKFLPDFDLPDEEIEEFEIFCKNNPVTLKYLDASAKKISYWSWLGLAKKGLINNPEYCERLKFELSVICKTEYAKYFAVVRDYVGYSWNVLGKYVGDRGSAGGSLVLYTLDITTTDPIEDGLQFDRFLTSEYGWVAEEQDFID